MQDPLQLKSMFLQLAVAITMISYLQDSAISAKHCRLERCLRGFVLRDLDSVNGTWMNGHRIRSAEVNVSSHIRIGKTDLYLVASHKKKELPLIEGMIAKSYPMIRAIQEAEHFAKFTWPVMIYGDSGVGKEEVARILHQKSSRSKGPFVAVNAGGIHASLIESELFGYERGSFTGAIGNKKGVFEQAHEGTLFLDEIGGVTL